MMGPITSRTDTDFLARLTVKRLAELKRTQARVESLQRSAHLSSQREAQRAKLAILARLSLEAELMSPQLRDMERYVSELKRYLQSVYDSDLLADPALIDITSEHCIGYAVHLLDVVSDSRYEQHGSFSVMELAASTLQMFCGRPAATPLLLSAGAVPVIVRLLSPLYPEAVVVRMANCLGALADDFEARLAVRAHGGAGALVRLLRPDVEAAVQAAAGSALSLLSARDAVIQDTVRHLGGIDCLVDLLATGDAYVSEVSRYALASLRRGNVSNQADVITLLRACPALSRDLGRLRAVSDMLRFDDGTPAKASAEAQRVAKLLDDLDERAAHSVHSSYRATPRSTYAASPSPHAHAARPASPSSARSAPYPESTYNDGASLHSSTTFYSGGLAPPPQPSPPRASMLTASYQSSMRGSPSLAETSLFELESELLRKKHLYRFSHEDVVLLLQEMGFEALDLRGVRVHRIDGADLLGMPESEMVLDLLLPSSKVHKLLALQAGARLFDVIATGSRQGRLAEIELRLYLASHGCGAKEVSKVLKLFCTLVRTDRFDFVCFWDFVTSYEWVAQAFRIYQILC
ncbi:hypothetical protein FOA52_001935 [Chlamydomonas sp. UWO 241]|nr:hypothetical protein FOA52_001935 [Chlamydomonas sp. UWO 241]